MWGRELVSKEGKVRGRKKPITKKRRAIESPRNKTRLEKKTSARLIRKKTQDTEEGGSGQKRPPWGIVTKMLWERLPAGHISSNAPESGKPGNDPDRNNF